MPSVCLRTLRLLPSPKHSPKSTRKSSPVEVPPSVMKPFPDLPSELVIPILDIAACSSHDAARSISLVSSWARKIALPHLFNTLVYRSKPAYSAGMSSGARDSPHTRKSQTYSWGPLVHNLWTESTGIMNAPNEGEIFRACPNVENLALVSASLRSLAPAVQAHTAARRQEMIAGHDPFLACLRFMTLITHTSRYDWHFLVGLQLENGSQLLHNITHLRLLDMTISSFSPHNLLPNLTHLALPYLDLGNDFRQESLRLPPGVLQHRSLRMIVLTVAEEKWLTNPWYQIARYPGKDVTSPKATFRTLAQWARKKDDRLHVVLSPRLGVDACKDWVDAARGKLSLWEVAAQARAEDSHGAGLPETYPKGMRR
ncbi:hypothetical protein L226DRAFT_125034 [Lentinus tigrinus ALCF2SS1-7]|uniref:Uncharacterized protein n=1 Tax=Lentinus tigrinus ALCF2SS1-6 TaxID=1328759 RepID=A0A5C2SUL4_9APHY|nr:hypothetical protein L227DRAFT_11083 [Lentinus tigrinus ALCF2SS1-6]RPD80943.1 hypothetical protein L226DRAFT_125034 [Lentinus tigrinus ALCF2SS1-7]